MSNQPSLRKAAVLIASLDTETADRLLDQMGAAQAARVRNAILELDEISPAEQEQALAEFFRRPARSTDDVELMLSPAARETSEAAENRPSDRKSLHSDQPDFSFLNLVPPHELYLQLQHEHPQTIALVLSRIAPQAGAELLRELTSEVREEVIDRLQYGADAEVEVLAEIERHLRHVCERYVRAAQLDPQRREHIRTLLTLLNPPVNTSPSVAAVLPSSELLKVYADETDVAFPAAQHASSSDNESTWSDEEPGLEDPESAEEAGPDLLSFSSGEEFSPSDLATGNIAIDDSMSHGPAMEFDEILSLPTEDFFQLFDEADPRVVMLALAGAPRRMFDRFVARFSPERAAEFERHLEQLRPFPLSDVVQAQRELAEIAERRRRAAILAAENSRFSAAVA